jgi:hypothetical protein
MDKLPWIHVTCEWCGTGFNTQDDMEEYCSPSCESLDTMYKADLARTEEGLAVDSDIILT